MWHSAVNVFIPAIVVSGSYGVVFSNGQVVDNWGFGHVIYTSIMITVFLKLFFETQYSYYMIFFLLTLIFV